MIAVETFPRIVRGEFCPRCRKPRAQRYARRRETIRDRYRIPGSYWPRPRTTNMAAVEGKGQIDSDGKLYTDTPGKGRADSASVETCCCPSAPSGCMHCSAYSSDITVVVSGVNLCVGCTSLGEGVWASPVAGGFSGTFDLHVTFSSCVWDNKEGSNHFFNQVTTLDASPWFAFFSDSGCSVPISSGTIYIFVSVLSATLARGDVWLTGPPSSPGGSSGQGLANIFTSQGAGDTHSSCATSFTLNTVATCGASVIGTGGQMSVSMT